MEKLFAEQKWNILQHLAREKYSPLQLAELSNTSMANISQQLRLLEAANLVKKEKIKNRDKGKPRTLFSLTNEYGYLVTVMDNFAEKRLLQLTPHHKNMLKIWFLKNSELHVAAEHAYGLLEPMIKRMQALVLVEHDDHAEFILVGPKPQELKAALSKVRAPSGITFRTTTLVECQKLLRSSTSTPIILHDSQGQFAPSVAK